MEIRAHLWFEASCAQGRGKGFVKLGIFRRRTLASPSAALVVVRSPATMHQLFGRSLTRCAGGCPPPLLLLLQLPPDLTESMPCPRQYVVSLLCSGGKQVALEHVIGTLNREKTLAGELEELGICWGVAMKPNTCLLFST